MEENKKLQVPTDIRLEWELWPGFGKKALIRTALCSSVVLGILLAGMIAGLWSVIIVTIGMIVAISFFTSLFSKLDNNQSVYDFLARNAEYAKEQQVFNYKRESEEFWLNEEAED